MTSLARRTYRAARLPQETPAIPEGADALRAITAAQRVQEAFLREKDTNPFLGALYTAWTSRHA